MSLSMRIIPRSSCGYWRIVPETNSLIQAYREAQDIHRMTASQVFHTPFEEVTDLQRRNAKAVNFGIVYGISSFGLSQDLSITEKKRHSILKVILRLIRGSNVFWMMQWNMQKKKGYVVTLFGRRRPVPELKSSNFMQRNFGERVAMNAPIQGTAADIMKIAMIGVNRELKEQGLRSRLILQVHDELLIETHGDEVEEVKGDSETADGAGRRLRRSVDCRHAYRGKLVRGKIVWWQKADMKIIGITGGVGSGKARC